jgi:peptidoglycan/LPS O-acetylase OafA/YrhL
VPNHFGTFGVMLFFLISGFIITHTAQSESRGSFLIRRAFRIYQPLILAVALTVWTNAINLAGHGPGDRFSWTWAEIIATASGWATILPVNRLVIEVSWTLTIELIFYLIALAILPRMRTQPLISIAVVIVTPMIVTKLLVMAGMTRQAYGFALIPVFAMGMAVYYAWCGRLSVLTAALACLGAWLGVVQNMWLDIWLVTPPFPVAYSTQIAYALIAFTGAMLAMRNVRANPAVVRFFADISYSLFLIHLRIGAAVMGRLHPHLGFTLSTLIGLVAVIGISALSFRFVERPSQQLARRLIARSPRL